MTEVNLSYDFIPGFDQQAYKEWAKKAIGTVLQSPGLVEFRAFRNVLGSPYVRTTTVWQSLTDWVNFFESPEWREIETELRDNGGKSKPNYVMHLPPTLVSKSGDHRLLHQHHFVQEIKVLTGRIG
jgi:heme-degrading monooxygenase HmoA